MPAIFSGTSRIACLWCRNEWTDKYRENILVEGQATEASVEYRKCPTCGKVENSTIYIAIESQHHPIYEGDPYSVHIPASGSAWETQHGESVWEKLFNTYLSSKQIEGRYGLKPGSVRKAVNRGYVKAKKDGHDLFILDSIAQEYWGHRTDEETAD